MTCGSKKEDKMLIEDSEKIRSPGLWGPNEMLLPNKLRGNRVHIFEIIFHDVQKV